jgi:hypothetical protein
MTIQAVGPAAYYFMSRVCRQVAASVILGRGHTGLQISWPRQDKDTGRYYHLRLQTIGTGVHRTTACRHSPVTNTW